MITVFAVLAALPAILVPASASQIVATLGLTTGADPAAPSSLKSYPVIGGVGLTWSAPGAAPDGYEIERRARAVAW